MEINLGDIVKLKKKHPCGSYEWEVVRLGADIGLKCTGCQRRVMLPRSVLERRMKGAVKRGSGRPVD
ncbi:MAG: DUF951 domain-containing protein [Dehalococcoidales bacterium]|nr:DUF951 domain-containing protein [Dehalococcoidales bacterium]